jgi:5'-nucleotidase
MDADFSYFESYILELTRHLIDEGIPYGVCYNINAPVGVLEGVRWTRQCRGFWQKEMEERMDESGEKYYWLTGEFVNMEPEVEDTDIWAMNNHYISVHPCTIDQTAYAEI